MYPVAIQLVFWSWLSSLPMAAYVDRTMVPSNATRNMPIDIGMICSSDPSVKPYR